jgi:hypothetical protein
MKMKPLNFIALLLLLSFATASAQVMNVRKWRKSERDSLDNALLLADEKFYLQALPMFERLLAQHPEETFLKYSYAKSALHRSDKHAEAYKLLTEVYEKNKKIPEINYEMALAAHYSYRFDEANQFLDLHLANKRLPPELRQEGERLRQWVANAKFHHARPTKAKVANLGGSINSPDDEYVPAITADESALIFTYAGAKSVGGRQNAYLQEDLRGGQFMEDIYISYKNPDAAISLSFDGHTLFLYKDEGDGHGDIYQSFLIGENFTKPIPLKGQVNGYSWDGHCSLSPDGRTLYFSSERSDGKGGRDIYRASLAADSSWTNIVSLGDSVNTPFDDDAPFIHADGLTLFFSSKGRNTMGGYDVYRSVMDPTDSAFKNVEHLGYPINSPSDDIYFVLAANGRNAYYSSGRQEGTGMKDIYIVETNFTGPRPSLYLVKGRVNADGAPSGASLKVEALTPQERLFNQLNANAVTGNYLTTLPAGSLYRLTFTSGEFPAQTFTIDALKTAGYKEQQLDVAFLTKRDTTPPPPPVPVATVAAAPKADTDGFVPRNKLQEKALRYIQDYGNQSAPGLSYKVQVAALRNTGRYYLPHLAKFGRIEKVKLGDGFTRLMLGGSFNTLRKAFNYNKKVVKAGQQDAFVIAIYKGKRVQFEELVKMGVLK